LFIPDPDPDFLPIPDPGSRVKKAPDPGSGFARLLANQVFFGAGTTNSYKAAAMLAEDTTKAEIFAKQCFTNCLFERNLTTCEELVNGRPGLAWARPLLLIYSQVGDVLAGKLPPGGQPLLHRLQDVLSERGGASLEPADLAAIQQFERTTTPSERERVTVLGVSVRLAEAYAARGSPQACLAALAQALALLHADARSIHLVKALFPKGAVYLTT
jgi:hypothetical protein